MLYKILNRLPLKPNKMQHSSKKIKAKNILSLGDGDASCIVMIRSRVFMTYGCASKPTKKYVNRSEL